MDKALELNCGMLTGIFTKPHENSPFPLKVSLSAFRD